MQPEKSAPAAGCGLCGCIADALAVFRFADPECRGWGDGVCLGETNMKKHNAAKGMLQRGSMPNKTCILDTNVYGEILVERESVRIVERMKNDKSLFVYGLDVIEQELSDVPSDKKIKGDIFRELALLTYKSLTDEELVLSPLAKYLASEYFKKYAALRKSGKFYRLTKSKEFKYAEADLKVDFEIIATASLQEVEVVVSADKRTMLSAIARETYALVNKVNRLTTPKLEDYFVFRKRYL